MGLCACFALPACSCTHRHPPPLFPTPAGQRGRVCAPHRGRRHPRVHRRQRQALLRAGGGRRVLPVRRGLVPGADVSCCCCLLLSWACADLLTRQPATSPLTSRTHPSHPHPGLAPTRCPSAATRWRRWRRTWHAASKRTAAPPLSRSRASTARRQDGAGGPASGWRYGTGAGVCAAVAAPDHRAAATSGAQLVPGAAAVQAHDYPQLTNPTQPASTSSPPCRRWLCPSTPSACGWPTQPPPPTTASSPARRVRGAGGRLG